MATTLGKIIQCSTPHQPKIIQQYNVYKFITVVIKNRSCQMSRKLGTKHYFINCLVDENRVYSYG